MTETNGEGLYLNKVIGQLILSGSGAIIDTSQRLISGTELSPADLNKLLNLGCLTQVTTSMTSETEILLEESVSQLNFNFPSNLEDNFAAVEHKELNCAYLIYKTHPFNLSLFKLTESKVQEISASLPLLTNPVGYLDSEGCLILMGEAQEENSLKLSGLSINPTNGSYSKLDIMLPVCGDYSYVDADYCMYILGGKSLSGEPNFTVFRLSKSKPYECTNMGTLLEPRNKASIGFFKNSLLIFGGYKTQNNVDIGLDSIEVLDLESGKSSRALPKLPNDLGYSSHYFHQIDSDRLLIAGGKFNSGSFSNKIYEFSLKYRCWRKSSYDLPEKLANGRAICSENFVDFIMGEKESSPFLGVLKYFPSNWPILNPDKKVSQFNIKENSKNLSNRLVTFDCLAYFNDGSVKDISSNYDTLWEFRTSGSLRIDNAQKKNELCLSGEGQLQYRVSYFGVLSQWETLDIFDVSEILIVGESKIFAGSIYAYSALCKYSNNHLEKLAPSDYYWKLKNRHLVRLEGNVLMADACGDIELTAVYSEWEGSKSIVIEAKYKEIQLVINSDRTIYRAGQSISVDFLGKDFKGEFKSILMEDLATIEILSKNEIRKISPNKGEFLLSKSGSGALMAKWEDLSFYLPITIQKEVLSFYISAPTTLNVGSSCSINALVQLEGEALSQLSDFSDIKFSSSNPRVASINDAGQLFANMIGKVTILALWEDKKSSLDILIV